MKLLENKGKELLEESGINIPPGIVISSLEQAKLHQFLQEHKKVIIKAQVASGKREKRGLIKSADNLQESLDKIHEISKKELIEQFLVEKKLTIAEEYFLAILYDTETRKPMILFSKRGGIDVEEQGKLQKVAINPLKELKDQILNLGLDNAFSSFIEKAYNCFEKFDCKTLEINPIIKTTDGLLYAGDAKITIDDNAIARQERFQDIEEKYVLTNRELQARKIDQDDYRGVAGKTFVELDGDIAVLASGGGASLACMDALIEAGGKPANYTEYSGNPPREKVRKLTEITLSKPNLKGCLVIGGKANFTDIYETLSGFMEAIQSIKPAYPIVIRRAGPRDKEAFKMIREIADKEGYNITLFGEETPMTRAAQIIVEKIKNAS